MFRKLLIALACSMFFGTTLAAQSNELVDELLTQVPVKAGHAAYLVLSAGGQVPEEATTDDALAWAIDKKWLAAGLRPDSPLALDQLSYLLMQAFGVKGGFFYSLFPGPRYALRELLFLKVASNPAWPDKTVAGDEAMRMLTKTMDLKEKK